LLKNVIKYFGWGADEIIAGLKVMSTSYEQVIFEKSLDGNRNKTSEIYLKANRRS